jgi:hypothetical protein
MFACVRLLCIHARAHVHVCVYVVCMFACMRCMLYVCMHALLYVVLV